MANVSAPTDTAQAIAASALLAQQQRMRIIAENIANVNTPAFQGRDVESFDKVLAGVSTVAPAQTQPGHMAGTAQTGLASLITDPPKARALDGFMTMRS